MKKLKTINLSITGLGIIIYSPFAVAHILEGEDYFSNHHMYADQIIGYTNKGTIVDIATGTPGDFIIHLFQGIPNYQQVDTQRISLQLGLEVHNNQVHIRDVYDLMCWTSQLPYEQTVELDNGFYSLMVDSHKPESGIWGDYQVVNMYFEKVSSLPKLTYQDFPLIYNEDHSSELNESNLTLKQANININDNQQKRFWDRLKRGLGRKRGY